MTTKAGGPSWSLREAHPPIPGESYNGYVARVAALERHPNTFELHRLAGLEWPQRTELAPGCIDGIAALADTLRIDPTELESRAHAALPNGGRSWRGFPLERRVLDLAVRRFSPMSLAASDHHRALWSIRPFPFCDESWEYLLDRCPSPHCGAIQRFYHPSGSSLCDHCGELLANAATTNVAPELRDRLRLAVGLLHHDPNRLTESLAALPEPIRALPAGEAFGLMLALARVWEPAIASRKRTIDHGMAPERLTRAIAEAWTLLEGWPTSLERLAADRLATRAGRFGDGNGGATLRFLLTHWHSDLPGVTTLVQSLRADLEDKGRSCPGLTSVMKASGTKPVNLVKLRREGKVETIFALDGNRAVPRVCPASAAKLSGTRRASMLIEEAATVIGIPIYGIEQVCAQGLLEWMIDPLPCPVRSPVRVIVASVEGLLSTIAANAASEPLTDPVHLDRATLGLGGGMKPWASILTEMSAGGVVYSILDGPSRAPIMKRVMIERKDMVHVRALRFDGFERFPARSQLTRSEAGEILNLRNASKAKRALEDWPSVPSGRPVVPVGELLPMAARVIHAPELAERFHMTPYGLERALIAAEVARDANGFDRGGAIGLVQELLTDGEALKTLARRSGRCPSVMRRLLRQVDDRYRPRGRRRKSVED